MNTVSGVAVDQADPSSPPVGSDGKSRPHRKISLTDEEVRLIAFEAARRGDSAQAARIAELIGEQPPKVGFFQKMPTRGEILTVVGVAVVAGVGAYVGVKISRRRSSMKSGGKVLKLAPPLAASR
jgi:hypothetical protein